MQIHGALANTLAHLAENLAGALVAQTGPVPGTSNLPVPVQVPDLSSSCLDHGQLQPCQLRVWHGRWL